jgi:hypothetical protein
MKRYFALFPSIFVIGCGSAPRARFHDPGELLARLEAQSSCSKAVSGEAKVSFRGDARKLSASVLFLAQAPDRLRFDATHSIAGTLATLTTDGARFSLASLEEKRFYEGPARACNVARFTQVPVPPSVFVELFRNRVPRFLEERGNTVSEESPLFGTFHYSLTVETSGARARARVSVHPDDFERPVSEQRLRLDYYALERGGVRSFDATFDGYRAGKMATVSISGEDAALGLEPTPPSGPECHAELASRARFFVESSGFSLDFSAMDLVHNPPLPEGVFLQEPRPGLAYSRAECADDPIGFRSADSETK